MENSSYRGLTGAEVRKRIDDGLINETNNNISKTKKEIVLTHTLTYFNFLNLFLGVIVICSGQLKNLTFLGVIIINSVIGIIQELKVKKLVDGLSVITASKVKVIRNSRRQEIPIDELVMDDVMLVESGNQIGADSIVLSGEGIEVNESMITGESHAVKKFKGDTLWSGSFLVAGSGVAQVIHVGKDNYAVELANKAKDKKRATSEMQDSIKRIIKIIGFVIIPVGILLFLSQRNIDGTSLSDAMVNTVAGVIGMIPEGLVLLTSISFILGVGRLAKKRALVQEMEAIEALARVNVLCTDKTGTITTGELKVKEIIPLGEEFFKKPVGDEAVDLEATARLDDMPMPDSLAKTEAVENIKTVMNEISFAFNDVNSTQTALMNYFQKTAAWEIEDLIPFSSSRKYRAIRFVNHGAYVLGAPEFILKDTEYTSILDIVEPYSKQGLRVLLLASAAEVSSKTETVKGIKPIGLILISDIIRTEAKATFDYFASQNVAVKVISGDNPATVSYIAVEAGLQDGDKYIDATQLPDDDSELRNVICDYTVFGRVTPEQKQRIIKAYQANEKIVGMVGDGVNDVLALKDADCGIAMAAGSDAAKQVAHIVLLDSDFACMQDIVREGRMIISNIERVSALYLTKTIYSVLLSVIFILLGRAYPFIPIHLSIISATAIGLPSFLLTLEQTETVTQNGFLKHVLRISLPGALTMVGAMLLNQVLAMVLGFDDTMLATYNLLIAGLISMLVLLYVCSPMNKKRKALCIICVSLFILALLVLPGFFSITSLFVWRMIFVVPLFWLVYVAMKLLVMLMRHVVK